MKYHRHLIASFRNMLRSSSGTSLIEFAFAFPMLLILLVGAIEVNRYILILQKVDKVAYTIADMVTSTQGPEEGKKPVTDELSYEVLNDSQKGYLNYFDELMDPYPVEGNGLIVVTSVYQPSVSAAPPVITWQVTGGNLNPQGLVSEISGTEPALRVDFGGDGQLGDVDANPPTFGEPTNFSTTIQDILSVSPMNSTENMIVVEVFYRFQPLLNLADIFTIEAFTMKRKAFFTPRNRPLTRLYESNVAP